MLKKLIIEPLDQGKPPTACINATSPAPAIIVTSREINERNSARGVAGFWNGHSYEPAHIHLWDFGGDWGVHWGACKEGPTQNTTDITDHRSQPKKAVNCYPRSYSTMDVVTCALTYPIPLDTTPTATISLTR